jgi:transcriptional regulator with XRE-family HTH domain
MPRRNEAFREIDLKVGARVRMLRILKGLSQKRLADELGITFQQVQKYEGGSNRISAGRLAAIARLLGVTAAELFADVADPAAAPPLVEREREALELLRHFRELPPGLRPVVTAHVRALARFHGGAGAEVA